MRSGREADGHYTTTACNESQSFLHQGHGCDATSHGSLPQALRRNPFFIKDTVVMGSASRLDGGKELQSFLHQGHGCDRTRRAARGQAACRNPFFIKDTVVMVTPLIP